MSDVIRKAPKDEVGGWSAKGASRATFYYCRDQRCRSSYEDSGVADSSSGASENISRVEKGLKVHDGGSTSGSDSSVYLSAAEY